VPQSLREYARKFDAKHATCKTHPKRENPVQSVLFDLSRHAKSHFLGFPVLRVQDKKIDTIVERYRINTNEVFQKQRHLRYHHCQYPLGSSDAD
jgi:hypothetical protein